METLTVTVNNRTYELSDEFTNSIERIAENEYGSNEFLSYYWRVAGSDEEEHAYGDPLLCIETEGTQVPWENLSEFEVEDVDSMNPRDDEEQDYKMVIFPEMYRPMPDPDDGKLSTLPPKPEEFDESDGPTMVVPIPENTRPERWAAGEAIVPAFTTVEWNLQRRADTVPAYGTYESGNSHDKWERWLKECDCAIADDSTHEGTTSSKEQQYDASDDIGPKYGSSAQNFRI